MSWFHLFSVLVVLAALFSYINYRVIKLPTAIGLMLVSMLFSLAILSTGSLFPEFKESVSHWLGQFNFSQLLLEVMLSFLLYAGAIHIKLEDLKQERLFVIMFSTLSVLLSTFLVGITAYYLLPAFGIKVQFIHALMFGSLISPTDPIAVLSILRKAGISKSLETKIAGESLFNDGFAVVIFMTLWQVAQSGNFELGYTLSLFGQEAIGGLVLGMALGWIGYKMIASIDNYQVEVLITLAIVMGGYTLAHLIHVSGPLAMVMAGIITGNQGKKFGMSDITADYIDKFWELIDEILNALLFVLMGLELLLVPISWSVLLVGILFIFITLIIRFISLYIPSLLIRFKENIDNRTLGILTWGGLRGGISIALALSLLPEFDRDIWVPITYIIVCFSILVQGTTVSFIPTSSDTES